MPTVREIMDPNLPTVQPSDTVERVVHVLREHDVPGVAVVNDGGRCVGMVTQADLVDGDEERRDRSELDNRRKSGSGISPAEERRGEFKVSGATDRKKLRQSLNDAVDNRLQ